MSVIKLIDENGNIIDIPSLKGDDGKLAYEYAKEGGYTGTRDEFLNDLTSISSNFNNHLEDDASHTDLRNECENLTPSINTDDENKMLRVVNGSWSKVDDVIIPCSALTNLADIVRDKTGIKNTLANFISNKAELTTFEFAEGLTKITREAFKNSVNLTTNEIPNTVTNIGAYAFYNCKKLNITEIPASVTNIAIQAFYGCTGLTSITFKGTPKLTSDVFENCINLKTINVPWAEGAVAGAPWGASGATINYNYTG